MANLIQLGPQYFPFSNLSTSVGAGNLYIGDVDTDPTIVGNQKTVEALQEDGSLVEISQPITLSAGGIPLYSGSPVSLYTDGEYSLTVTDINGAQVYYVPSTPGAIFEGGATIEGDLTIEGNTIIGGNTTIEGNLTINELLFDIDNVAYLNVAQLWSKQQHFNEAELESSGNEVAWDLDDAQTAFHTMTEDTEIKNPSNMVAGTYILRVIQAAGEHALTWDTAFEWGAASAPSEPAANGDVIIISFYSDGSTMYGAEFSRVEA